VIPCLRASAAGRRVCGVLTSPDKPKGRGRRTEAPPVKEEAVRLGLPVLQPHKLDSSLLDRVSALRPDVLVVAAYSKIFKKEFLDLFPLGRLNIHPSLLPRFRGPSPVQAAILSGDTETGVTVQSLSLRMDAGDILAQRRIALVGDETTPDLLETSFQIGAELLSGVLRELENGPVSGTPQREEEATYCGLIERGDGLIDWAERASLIERRIRAYLPWPRAHTRLNGAELALLSGGAVPADGDSAVPPVDEKAGTVIGVDKRRGLLIQTGEGILSVDRLQLQARKAMDWRAFLNGVPSILGSRLGD